MFIYIYMLIFKLKRRVTEVTDTYLLYIYSLLISQWSGTSFFFQPSNPSAQGWNQIICHVVGTWKMLSVGRFQCVGFKRYPFWKVPKKQDGSVWWFTNWECWVFFLLSHFLSDRWCWASSSKLSLWKIPPLHWEGSRLRSMKETHTYIYIYGGRKTIYTTQKNIAIGLFNWYHWLVCCFQDPLHSSLAPQCCHYLHWKLLYPEMRWSVHLR